MNEIERKPATNSRFAKAGVSCFYDSEVLNSSFVHLMKFSAKNPRLRKAANRCGAFKKNVTTDKFCDNRNRIPFLISLLYLIIEKILKQHKLILVP